MKDIQVGNVLDRLHRELTRRARAGGLPLADYVRELLEREVEGTRGGEVLVRIGRREPVDLGRPAAELIREERAWRQSSWAPL